MSEWACSKCTFLNKTSQQSCDMCGNRRSGGRRRGRKGRKINLAQLDDEIQRRQNASKPADDKNEPKSKFSDDSDDSFVREGVFAAPSDKKWRGVGVKLSDQGASRHMGFPAAPLVQVSGNFAPPVHRPRTKHQGTRGRKATQPGEVDPIFATSDTKAGDARAAGYTDCHTDQRAKTQATGRAKKSKAWAKKTPEAPVDIGQSILKLMQQADAATQKIEQWSCLACTLSNPKSALACVVCGTQRGETYQQPHPPPQPPTEPQHPYPTSQPASPPRGRGSSRDSGRGRSRDRGRERDQRGRVRAYGDERQHRLEQPTSHSRRNRGRGQSVGQRGRQRIIESDTADRLVRGALGRGALGQGHRRTRDPGTSAFGAGRGQSMGRDQETRRGRGRGKFEGNSKGRGRGGKKKGGQGVGRGVRIGLGRGAGRGRGALEPFNKIPLGRGAGRGVGRGRGEEYVGGKGIRFDDEGSFRGKGQGVEGGRNSTWEAIAAVTSQDKWAHLPKVDKPSGRDRGGRERGGRGRRREKEVVRFVNVYREDGRGLDSSDDESKSDSSSRSRNERKKKVVGEQKFPSDQTLDVAYRFEKAERRKRWPRHIKSGSVVLHVAEKPSIAEALAKAFSTGEYRSEGSHPYHTPVHSFQSEFLGATCMFKVTSVTGHVYNCDYVQGYESWEKTEGDILFKVPTLKKPTAGSILRHLSAVATGVDLVVLWLDCDPEGENICFEVLNTVVQRLTTTYGQSKRVFRAVFSSLAAVDLRKALSPPGTPGGLVSPNINVSKSVDARQILDLKMGVSFTRFQTVFLRQTFSRLANKVISFGPCQTPTLGLCVTRFDEIQEFTPEKFWQISANLHLPPPAPPGSTLPGTWASGRTFDQKECIALLEVAKKEAKGYAVIDTVKVTEKKMSRPLPLNTTALLKAASRGLGLSPHETMRTAEHLYTSGYISYPRTETTAYSKNFDVFGLVKGHVNHPDWGDAAKDILSNPSRPKGGVDMGDHPPITPVRSVGRSELGGREWKVYDYVSRHFLASLLGPCVVQNTEVEFSVGSERFSSKGKQITEPGFTNAMPWLSPEETELPYNFQKGQKFSLARLEIKEGITSPPGLLTEAELIEQMEKHGIGTDASIPAHIKSICDRKYVNLQPGRRLAPSTLGIVLAHSYRRIDNDLISPLMRSKVERELKQIASGTQTYEAVLKQCLNRFKNKFQNFRENVTVFEAFFQAHFSNSGVANTRDLSKCGKCKRWMVYDPGVRPPVLSCTTCGDAYTLPPGGSIKIFGRECPLDGFELLTFKAGGPNGISYPLCPYCFNYPPFEDIGNFLKPTAHAPAPLEKRGGGQGRSMPCNLCPHASCPHSFVSLALCVCPYCQRGSLVLDPTSRPIWKVSCNACDRLIKFADGANKVTLSKAKCETCKARKVRVEYGKGKSPIPGGETKRIGCLACDPVLNDTTEVVKGRLTKGRGGRRHGRRRKGGRRKGGGSEKMEIQIGGAGSFKARRMRVRS
ncbi:hypothetical protein AAMO2058_000705300 [Amorphochlora amoebiformis]